MKVGMIDWWSLVKLLMEPLFLFSKKNFYPCHSDGGPFWIGLLHLKFIWITRMLIFHYSFKKNWENLEAYFATPKPPDRQMKDFWEVSRRNEIRGNVFGVIWGKSNQAYISILYQNSASTFTAMTWHSSLIQFYFATFWIIVIFIVIYPLLSRRRFLHSFLTLPSSSPLRPLETFIWHSHHPPRPIHIEWNDYPKFSLTTITVL